jgi:transcription-repair coupling factor (superfamily II helicase)
MFLESEFFLKLEKGLKSKTPPVLEEVPSGAKALIAAEFLKNHSESILYLTADNSPKILDDLEFFGFKALELPSIQEIETSSDVRGLELKTLASLKENPIQLVCASIQSLTRQFINPKSLKNDATHFAVSKAYDFNKLKVLLESMGYKIRNVVTEKGTFAIRGCIVDIFGFNHIYPVRLEFDEDDLISLREFDPVLQTSLKKLSETSVMSCEESTDTVSIFDYLSKKPLIIFDGIEELEEQWVFSQRLKSSSLSLNSHKCLLFSEKPLSVLFSQKEDVKKFLDLNLNFKAFQHPFLHVENFFITSSKPSLEELRQELPTFYEQNGKAHIIYTTEAEKRLLTDAKLNAELKPGFLSQGFFLAQPPQLVLSFQDFQDKKHIRRSNVRLTSVSSEKEFELFNEGDIVVHATQGIGKCLGVEKRMNHLGQESEYFKLEFAEKAILYVPIKDANLITKYVGTSQSLPTFSQLGSNRWQKIRAQTQASIIGYAQKLLELAAKRQMDKGFTYPSDSDIVTQFEQDFPFTATDDQLRAISSIKEDMQKGVPMDRLICGDVGYGKTEVAMRAAFKAVLDGHKQVAVLVPTTVLAMQHYENFKDRMSKFPVTLGILSRFNSAKEIKNTLESLKQGSIDIVVGTHRLLSKDIVFKDLGLMIIDEEQRFGVKAKETLKQLKTTVDCLTLSATPIPRTLYTSIVGMKQMSVIATPPYDRLPVKTILTVTDDAFIRQALLREMSRRGQSYFIHNRVENLPLIHKKLQEMVPEARIGIAHGQMDAEDIDTVFHAFKTGQLDILIATTLVENGVDIPNANTILIDNSHHFGLSDLYQLRGRVGRWNKAATCYLLIPKNYNLDEATRKRLEAIVSTSGYGGGLKVAMKDLEIRGAGDLLGIEQSGHVSQVGFTLYCRLLKKTISSMQRKLPVATVEPKIEFSFESKIPEMYIQDLDTRIEFYHRFGDVDSEDESDNIFKEMIDRFGPAPISAMWLYALSKIKVICQNLNIPSLSIHQMSCIYTKSVKGKIEKKVLAINSNLSPQDYVKNLKSKLLNP